MEAPSQDCTGWWCEFKRHMRHGCNKDEPCLWYYLGIAYACLAIATLVQLIRILKNMSGYPWTMQKTFHVLNLVMCTARAVVLFVWNVINHHGEEGSSVVVLDVVLFNFPGLLFFSTYTLLVLFWAEIVHAAQKTHPIAPKAVYTVVNVLAYLLSIVCWVLCGREGTETIGKILDSSWHIVLSLLAATGFVAYGYMLMTMLNKSPVVSAVRRKKFIEIAVVTVLSVLCFCGKAALEIVAVVEKRGLDYTGGLLIDGLFFGVMEVLVIIVSLVVLSGMPPKQEISQERETLLDH